MSESSVQLPPNSTLVIGEETAQTARKRKVEQNKRQQTKYLSAIKFLIGAQGEEFKHEQVVTNEFRHKVKTYIENHQYAVNTVKTGNAEARSNRQAILNQLTAAVTLEQFKEIREGEQLEPIINPLSIVGSSAIIRRLKIKTIERKMKTAQAVRDLKHIAKVNKVKQKFTSRFGAKLTKTNKKKVPAVVLTSESEEDSTDPMDESFINRATMEEQKSNTTSGNSIESKVADLRSFTHKGDLNSQGLSKLSVKDLLKLDLNGATLYGLSEFTLTQMRNEALQYLRSAQK